MLVTARDRRAVTRLETLVILVVVLLFVSVGIATLSHVREGARAKLCLWNLARYGEAFAAYAIDYDNVLPYENIGDESLGRIVWFEALSSYLPPATRICPSVDRSQENYRESYRMNSKLANPGAEMPTPYRRLDTLNRRGPTVILFDAEYGGQRLSFKGKLKDVAYRHSGAAHVLFADWRVEGFDRQRMKRESEWLPPKVLWDPDAGRHRAPDPPETKRPRTKRSKNRKGGG